jgi:DNA-binding XRE family transcriptional regulator
MNGTHYDFKKLASVRERKYTQEEFAKLLGVHVVTLSRVENGHAASFELINKICKLLDINSKTVFRSGQPVVSAN